MEKIKNQLIEIYQDTYECSYTKAYEFIISLEKQDIIDLAYDFELITEK